MVLAPRNEVTSREWHYYSKIPSKKLGVREINWIWSKSQPLSHCQFHERSLPIISFCDEKDVKLTTYNVLSPPLASPQQFPTCNEKVLHSHLALEWTACLQRQTSKLLHCINRWITLNHITIASQILSDLPLNQIAFNSHLSRCFGVDGWKPCEDLRKDVRWPRVCARLQKAVGEERIIALQAPRRWPMLCNVGPAWSLAFSYVSMFSRPPTWPEWSRLSSRKRIHSFWYSICSCGISEMLVNIWRQGQTAGRLQAQGLATQISILTYTDHFI